MQAQTTTEPMALLVKEAIHQPKEKYYNFNLCFKGGFNVNTFTKTQEERKIIKQARKKYNKLLFRTFGTKRPTAGILNKHFGI